ncbi:unnamed protein product [Ambrosiozyma monospora]|uniref:Kinase n=1 Tax=Ambrosiozyma monospora TaxID=43982 RepID=A0A9W6YZF8_AMBMO|nr:unnamed protein product [Ambrosiozyma monospora]
MLDNNTTSDITLLTNNNDKNMTSHQSFNNPETASAITDLADTMPEIERSKTHDQRHKNIAGRKAAKSFRLFRGLDSLEFPNHSDTLESNELKSTTGVTEVYEPAFHFEHLSRRTTNKQQPQQQPYQKQLPSIRSYSKKRSESDFDVPSPLIGDETKPLPLMEPVSSAIYFPHTPLDSEAPLIPKHLMATAEFDHGSNEGELIDEIEEIEEAMEHENKFKRNSIIGPSLVPELISGPESANTVVTDMPDIRQKGDIISTQDVDHTSKGNFNDFAIVEDNLEDEYPLAVELKPFKNKVGGHTAIFKFSHRAICKVLVNREDTWYENIERTHPELLRFMPRYIGVLNVRYSSLVDDNDDTNQTVDSITDDKSPLLASKGSRISSLNLNRGNSTATVVTPTNMISGIDSPLNLVTPEVTIEDNRHIVPDSLWTHYSNSAPSSNILSQPANSSPLVSQLPSPNLGALDKEFNDVDSLGATTK